MSRIHEHKWNYFSSRTDGFYEGYPCDYCSAFITPDNIVIEAEDDLVGQVSIIVFIVMILGYIVIKAITNG